ncbi:unnamed protein product [Effrenium voratum]|uniref:OmpA-like domain-containing protein n=1 Tax=Effrenium voratum TaxID=2562239 RepID=A0AA36JBH6_9DINO|nr:unnamed protein product [Effrenium voratum]
MRKNSGALSAAGRAVAGGAANGLQTEKAALQEAEARCAALGEKLRVCGEALESLRPRLKACGAEAHAARAAAEELQQAMDALGDSRAKAAQEVGALSKRQLSEIRQLLRSPPEPVKRTLAAAWLLLHCQRFKDKPPSAVRFDEKTDWPRCQRMLVDDGFKSSVLSFDTQQLDQVPSVPNFVAKAYLGLGTAGGDPTASASTVPAARPLLRRSATVPVKPPLDVPQVVRASEPCGPLLRWVQELVSEHVSRVKIQAALTEAQAKKTKAEAAEAAAEADVAEAEAALSKLREALAAQEAALAALQAEKSAAEKALQDLRKLEGLEVPRLRQAAPVPKPSTSKVEVPIELELSGTLAVVEQKLAQCGIPFMRTSAQLLEGDVQQAMVLPKIAEILKEHRGKLKLQLEGHQAEGEEPGMDIERSLAVYQWLVEVAGHAPGLLRLKGCGSAQGRGQLVVPVPIQELVARSGPLPPDLEGMPCGLYFSQASTELLPEAELLLQAVSKALKEDERAVRLEGHVDKEENPDLAGQRAARVRELLMALGVPRTQMRPQSCKALHPLSRTRHAANRRVEVHIL